MSTERPSPFTIPEPQWKFSEGPSSEPVPPRSMTLGSLIQNLVAFAHNYEDLTTEFNHSRTLDRAMVFGTREANAASWRDQFRAVGGIDELRALVLSRYGED